MTGRLTAGLPPERPGTPAAAELAAIRQGMAVAAAARNWRTARPAVADVIGGVRVLRFRPSGTPWASAVHFHGGGFRMGCPEASGPYAAELAARCGVEVICPAYRLAPESPFPAGLVDAARVVEGLGAPERAPIILSGDSAGGGLAAGVAGLCAAQGMSIAGLVLHSPWLDLTVTSDSYAANGASDPLFSRTAAEAAGELYLQGHDPRDRRASPLFASLAGLPPTLITVGSGEVLLGDASAFHAGLANAGVTADLRVIAGMDHVAVMRGLSLPGAAAALAATTAFIDGLRAWPATVRSPGP